jgi:hypothetical protein
VERRTDGDDWGEYIGRSPVDTKSGRRNVDDARIVVELTVECCIVDGVRVEDDSNDDS